MHNENPSMGKHTGQGGRRSSVSGRRGVRPRSYRPPRRRSSILPALLAFVLALVLVGGGAWAINQVFFTALPAATSVAPQQSEVVEAEVPQTILRSGRSDSYQAASKSGQMGRATLSAVGDVIMNQNILDLVDGLDGVSDKKSYDFNVLFDRVRQKISSYDISIVNQETVYASDEKYPYVGYPSFNTPDSEADALVNAGWNVVINNSNHSLDYGIAGANRTRAVLDKFPQIMNVGNYQSDEDRQDIRVVEVNGIKIAILAYSYGQNTKVPNTYTAPQYSEELLTADVAKAKEVSDFIVLYMHWGSEYTHVPNDNQEHYAQVAANLGVGMVIGTHAHAIQSAEWLDRVGEQTAQVQAANGGKMLVVYGLGDFIAGYHNFPMTIMSGMFSCELVKDENGSVSVENTMWHPAIEHWDNGLTQTYWFEDYSDELARQNDLLTKEKDPYAWIRDTTSTVIGGVMPIEGISAA